MTIVKFYDTVDDSLLRFAVIVAKSSGKWVFCKHRERDTYECPGGHREAGEKIGETARRELYEETGAVDYTIKPVCVYSVTAPDNFDGKETFGMLYYARIETFEAQLHSEIERIELFDELPENWTYPQIQPLLLREVEKRMNTAFLENYYNRYDEDGRLENSRVGKVEYLTTRRYLDPLLTTGCKIAEIGAGTGRYSVTLAEEGYDVTAVELVQHNLDILKSKLDGSERIKACLGNALDLNMLEDNAYDITLLLGPMYHLYSEEDKLTALREAVRITKPGGHILVAYCMNEAVIIQYVFGCNQLRSVMNLDMITDDWKCVSEPKDLFEMVRIEDIDRLNKAVPVERVRLIAADGASRYIRDYLEGFDDETFDKWLDYHFKICERQDLIGATNHALDILRKV